MGGATEAESEFPAAQLRCYDGCAHGLRYMIDGILKHLDSWTARPRAAQALVYVNGTVMDKLIQSIATYRNS